MSFEEKLTLLRARNRELETLRGVQALLNWDQLVYMPSAGSEDRSQQNALMGALTYDKSTDPELGQLVEDLAADIPDLDADEVIAREIKVAKRNYDLATKVPKPRMIEFITTTSVAQDVWARAKKENDYASFLPHLQHIISLLREMADFFKPYDHPYDALLMQFDPGMKTAEVKAIFDALRPRQVELIHAIAESRQVDDGFRADKYDISAQRKIGYYVATLQGYDWTRGRIDDTLHPFTTNFSQDDVRITTHYLENDLLSAFFSTMHETGHALYEQGVASKLKGTSLGSISSTAMHESQSRLWENVIGRSRDFCAFLLPTLQAFFPEHLSNLSPEEFYLGVNKVTPSLIRTESDEATYNLHIMLRMEIELGLLEGSIDPRHLPELWNAKMQEYLGITPKSDSEGVLQDVHWSGGMFGYFPGYALGNLVSVQLWDKMLKDHPGIPEEMRTGNLRTILAWLRENIHSFGGQYDLQDLVLRATGEKINPDHYVTYLNNKYREIYQL